MGIDYKQVFERMLKAGNFKNSSEMARVLGMTPQAISNHKKRGELSAGLIIRIAQKCNVSVDWLLTGNGQSSVRGHSGGDYPTQDRSAAVVTHEESRVESGESRSRPETEKAGIEKTPESRLLCPEEVIYIGKLLKILRSGEKQAPPALKANIDAIMGAVYPGTYPLG